MLNLSRPLVFLDLEATGTDPQTARIFQIAMHRLVPHRGTVQIDDKLVALVDPGINIPDRIKELTGITTADVTGERRFREVAEVVEYMIEDADLAGYNALAYDVPLLEAEYERIGEPLPGPEDRVVIDPYLIERQLTPMDLSSVFERRTGDPLEEAHDARADVEATVEVLLVQLRRHPEEIKFHTVEHLAEFQRGPYLDDGRKLKKRDDGAVEVCFGKHRGKTLGWIRHNDPGYFGWMHMNVDGLAKHINAALD